MWMLGRGDLRRRGGKPRAFWKHTGSHLHRAEGLFREAAGTVAEPVRLQLQVGIPGRPTSCWMSVSRATGLSGSHLLPCPPIL